MTRDNREHQGAKLTRRDSMKAFGGAAVGGGKLADISSSESAATSVVTTGFDELPKWGFPQTYFETQEEQYHDDEDGVWETETKNQLRLQANHALKQLGIRAPDEDDVWRGNCSGEIGIEHRFVATSVSYGTLWARNPSTPDPITQEHPIVDESTLRVTMQDPACSTFSFRPNYSWQVNLPHLGAVGEEGTPKLSQDVGSQVESYLANNDIPTGKPADNEALQSAMKAFLLSSEYVPWESLSGVSESLVKFGKVLPVIGTALDVYEIMDTLFATEMQLYDQSDDNSVELKFDSGSKGSPRALTFKMVDFSITVPPGEGGTFEIAQESSWADQRAWSDAVDPEGANNYLTQDFSYTVDVPANENVDIREMSPCSIGSLDRPRAEIAVDPADAHVEQGPRVVNPLLGAKFYATESEYTNEGDPFQWRITKRGQDAERVRHHTPAEDPYDTTVTGRGFTENKHGDWGEGQYYAHLTVQNENGVQDVNEVPFVVTEESYELPSVDVSVTSRQPFDSNELITLEADVTPGTEDVESVEWTFEYRSNETGFEVQGGTGTTIERPFPAAGTWRARVTVTDTHSPDGWENQAVHDFQVDPERTRPVADFVVDPSPVPQPGVNVVLDANKSYAPEGSLQSWHWEIDPPFTDYTIPKDGERVTLETVDVAGDWDVKLEVTDKDGVVDTSNRTFTVLSGVEAVIEGDDVAAPGGTASLDASSSVGNINSYVWSVREDGPSLTENGDSAELTFSDRQSELTSPETFHVDLTVHAAETTETTTHEITLTEKPTPDFTYTPDKPFTSDTVTFDGSASEDSDGSIVRYEWKFPDGGYREGVTADYSFVASGEKNVTLRVTDEHGMTNAIEKRVKVKGNDVPIARASADPKNPAPGEEVTFDASESTDPDGKIKRYEWKGAVEGSGPTVTATFDAIGGKTATVTVSDNKGATAEATAGVYVSNDPNQGPVAEFDGPTSTTLGESVTFDASASSDPDGTIESYEWTIERKNGPSLTKAGEVMEHTFYHDRSDRTVTLTVTDDRGATDSMSETVTITRQSGPTARVSYSPRNPRPGDRIEFDGSGSTSDGPRIDSYSWDIAGTANTGEVVTHAFDESGDYDVSLTVTQKNGNSDTQTVTVPVNAGPTATATASPSNPHRGDTVTFDASGSTDSDGSIVRYNWSGAVSGSGETVSTSFSTIGSKTATVEVTDDDGATATATTAVYVTRNDPPEATLSADADTVNVGEPVTFDASGSSDPDGTVESYDWSGVDGNGSTVTGSFDVPGEKTVEVTATDDDGATDTASVTVTVNAPPTAEISTAPSLPTPDETVTFDGSGSSDPDGTIASYDWTIDGSSASGKVVERSFSSSGDVSVTLTVTDDHGATDRTSTTVVVNEAPTADVTASPHSPQPGEPVTFDASGSSDPDGTVESYDWKGDVSGSGQTVSTSFSALGSKTVTVEVTDDDGATATATTAVYVTRNDPPEATLSVDADTVNVGEPVTFDASGSSDPDGAIESYAWDGVSGSGSSVTASFTTPGEKSVTVEVTDDDGATDSASASVTVNAPPSAVINGPTETPTVGEPVTFDGSNSSDPDGSIVSYEWEIDGTSASGKSVDHTFSSGGSKSVSLTVTDDHGATDTTSTTVTVNEPPTAGVSASPHAPAPGDSVTFDASGSSDPDGSIVDYDWSGAVSGSGPQLSTTFSSIGSKTVTVEVTDDDGATDTATTAVYVSENDGPVADLSASDTSVETGDPVTFDASGSSDSDGSIVDYDWSGVSGSGDSVTASFSSTGSKTVTVTVTDDEGATDSDSVTVDVDEPNQSPNASASASPNSVTPGDSVTFDASGSSDPDGSIVDYDWSGDVSGNGETVTTSFSSLGGKTAHVTVTDDDGATDTATAAVYVETSNDAPDASVSASPHSPTPGETVTFDASGSSDSDGSIVDYDWSGDVSGSGSSVSTSYNRLGSKTVTVEVTDDDGATDSATTSVYVQSGTNSLRALLSASQTSISPGDEVTFDASGSDTPSDADARYSWGGDVSGSGPSLRTRFYTPGIHTVTLSVEDELGRTDRASMLIFVADDGGGLLESLTDFVGW